jgi:hypothetical protein
VRTGEKVRSVYVCGGEMAVMMATLDDCRRELSAGRTRPKDDPIVEEIDAVFAEIQNVLSSVLEKAGFHRQKRGPWRKKRKPKN